MLQTTKWLALASVTGMALGCTAMPSPLPRLRSSLVKTEPAQPAEFARSTSPVSYASLKPVRLPPVSVEEERAVAAHAADLADPANPIAKYDVQQVAALGVEPETLPSGRDPTPVMPGARRRPAYALNETYPIDLPNVIRLVNANSPSVGFATARVSEAIAQHQLAKMQWLPNLSAGVLYNRFDGETQNQVGTMFNLSRSNLFNNGGVGLNVSTADAIFNPLIARQTLSSAQFRANSALQTSELDAVLGYLDLIQLYAQLTINADTLAKAEQMLDTAIKAKAAQLDRTAGDVQRARAEVLFRRQERLDLQGRAGVASARLAKLLLLDPYVKLVPVGDEVVPITLIGDTLSLPDLVGAAIDNRPDFAAYRETLAAAWTKVRKAQTTPYLPKLGLQDNGGSFGGGTGDTLSQFNARNVITAQILWEIKNLGFGNKQETATQRAQAEQAEFQLSELRARLMSEVVESAQVAAAKYESLEISEQAVKEAVELYRISKEGTFNVIDAKNLFDALRPLQAIQTVNQANLNYLNAVMEFNRAQYRLYTAMGCPSYLLQPK